MDIILVDEADNQVGTMEKMEVHQKALLHRAFSIFIFNEQGKMLLQKRATLKYHSAGLWTNACCSHPAPGMDTLKAAYRRLEEEMGFNVILEKAFDFIYKAPFDNGLTEHEFDHVFIGKYDGEITPNAAEVSDFCFMSLENINLEIQKNPDQFTVWFKIAFPKVTAHFARLSLTT